MRAHYRKGGISALIKKVPEHLTHIIMKRSFFDERRYQQYIENVEPHLFSRYLEGELSYKPKISVVMPFFNVKPEYLHAAIDSLLAQTYENWELCIHNDASTEYLENIEYIMKLATEDKRIKYSSSDINQNIALASNHALKSATGEYVALMDNDDTLDQRAFEIFVKAINKDRNLMYIYSDFDKIGLDGRRVVPIFKPDWSPNFLLSMMYTNHLHMFKTELVREAGGFRGGFEAAQDYDLVLRYTERLEGSEILHIPLILYHWRMIPGSTAVTFEEKGTARESSRKALEDTINRRELDATLDDGMMYHSFRVRYDVEDEPLVSIIIPTFNQRDMLAKIVDGVLHHTSYKNIEVLIIDNRSDEEETLKYLNEISKNEKVRVLEFDEPYNFSKIQNLGAKESKGEHLLLLNNDTEVIEEDWLTSMLELSIQPQIGAVGCMLLYPNDTYQHVGIETGIQDVAGHGLRGDGKDDCGYYGRAHIIRDLSAVTAACLMVKRSIFEEVGGFDESLPVSFNDVDFCLSVNELGYHNVYTPHAVLYHHEMVSRGSDLLPERIEAAKEEAKYIQTKWGDRLINDPYYSINLTRKDESYSFRTEIEESVI